MNIKKFFKYNEYNFRVKYFLYFYLAIVYLFKYFLIVATPE